VILTGAENEPLDELSDRGYGSLAALAGLVIVAVSVNISRILSYPHLPARAGATIAALLLILVTTMAALIPQAMRTLGIEVICFGLLCWLLQLRAASRMLLWRKEQKRPWYEAARGIALGQVQTVPFLVAGVLLRASRASGLYWLATGTILVFVLSMFNAWVLLVEILR
jgi:hypothetical protein